MYSFSRCKNRTTSTGNETTPFQSAQYRADNGNLRKLGSSYRHGIVFATKQ